MSDYSAVAPPQSNNQSTAFAAAIQRARLIAAKINPGGGSDVTGQKRPLEDGSGMDWTEPEAKKAASVNDIGSAQIAAIRQQAAAMAAVVSASGGGPRPVAMGQPHLGGGIMSEDMRVPDKMVGLIIGRGGEQITRLQNEAGCKIQMAPDSGGLPERVCTLTGPRDAINEKLQPDLMHTSCNNRRISHKHDVSRGGAARDSRARELVMSIITQRSGREGGDNGGPPGRGGGGGGGGGGDSGMGGNTQIELMVPGPKVGLIIGKGGETIKQLQERTGAKLVVIQEGPESETEKPLRISGNPQSIEYAKQLVYELLADKEMQPFGRGGGGPRGPNQNFNNDFGGGGGGGGGGGDSAEVAVPRAAVGVVIGKGGDMIKKIQTETGARVQFQQGRDDGPGDRRCLLTGKPSQVDQARRRIEELIDSVLRRDGEMGRGGGGRGGGRGDGRPRDNGGPPQFDRRGGGDNFGGPGGGGWDRRPGGVHPNHMNDKQEITFTVPATKCGIIIGRGGETIKQINQQTGAHCELDRKPPPNPNEKLFVIRGSMDQIEHAKRLISEKIGMAVHIEFPPQGPGNNPQGTQYPLGGQGQQGGQAPPHQFAPQGWSNAYQPWQNAPNDPNASSSVQVNPQTGQPDYSMQWAEYYRSLGMMREAEMIEQQAKAQKGMQSQATPQAPQSGPQTGGVSQNGQPDYSLQWADYYRSVGKIKEAEAIESQIKMNKSGQTAGQAPPQQAPGGQVPGSQAYQAYGYSAPGYYGGQGQAPAQNQAYSYPGYGGYGGQPQGPDN